MFDEARDYSEPYARVATLVQAINALGFDLILCGSQSLDDGAAHVGPCISELLGLPQVSAIIQLEVSPDKKKARVQRKLERGNREVVECPLPAVFTVEASINQPRYPSLPSYMTALQKDIQLRDLTSLGVEQMDIGQ